MADVSLKQEKLEAIRKEVTHLTDSPLYQYRRDNNYLPVIGEGSPDAPIMFIGEAPGRNEAQTGRPFCGAAGKILDELLDSVSIPREKIYIANILKDRPPENRDPLPDEIKLYGPFLERQIDIIQPTVLATLGRFSLGYIFDTFGLGSLSKAISVMHGRVLKTEMSYGEAFIVPLYHPAVAVYNSHTKDMLKKDFTVLGDFYRGETPHIVQEEENAIEMVQTGTRKLNQGNLF